MASLIARSAAADLVPVSYGPLTLSEVTPESITSLAALSAASVPLPEPGQTAQAMGGEVIWSGRGQAFHVGPRPDPVPGLAMTDQSDAWCILRLEGDGAADVLARLTPLDLNPAILRPGSCARSLLGHMNALFVRRGADAFEMWVFRSMAGTAVHELTAAMRGVVARADL